MEFYIVNSYFDIMLNHLKAENNHKYLVLQNYTSIQWLTKYQDTGEFSIECVDSLENRTISVGNCIYRNDINAYGVIEEAEFNNGKVVFRGYLDALDKIINKVEMKIQNVESGIKKILESNHRGHLKYSLIEKGWNLNLSDTYEVSFDSLKDILINVCKRAGIGYRMSDVYEIELFKGITRKDAILSDEIGNITNQKLYFDNVDSKNRAIVVGEDKSGKAIIVEVDNPNNQIGARAYAEKYVDAKNTKITYKDANNVEKSYTDAEYRNILYQRGLEELLKCNQIEEFSCVVNEVSFSYQYGKDFWVGDILPVRSKKYNKNIYMQVSEVREIWEAANINKKRVRLTLKNIGG